MSLNFTISLSSPIVLRIISSGDSLENSHPFTFEILIWIF
jgi:hypothetical protein